ncbi:hypothetical protein AgCh_033342 [Apium graveolens]
MTFDRSWIGRSRFDAWKNIFEDYKKGVASFIKFASEHVEDDSNIIRWPYQECENKYWKGYVDVTYDLYRHGIMEWYTKWDLHGEKNVRHVEAGTSSCSIGQRDVDMYDVMDMLRDIGEANRHLEDLEKEPNASAKDFYKMLDSASEPIYPNNTDFTALSFVNKLLHFKNKHNCSNNGFDELLKIIASVLPPGHKLPLTYYEVRKMIKGLHMRYEKINACENDCILFYKENSEKTHCDICTVSQYKVQKDPKKKIPKKILRYFPLTERLQRLYMNENTAECMKWHHNRVVVDGQLSHPADGDNEWKQFDRRLTNFTKEIRNVRLGLSADGFDPFRDSHAREYTVWPVVVVVYNLLPSMCTKAPYMFKSLLIPGPNDPTKDFHVYLRPLIDELKLLWRTGVQTYRKKTKDNSKARKDCKELGVHRELWIQDGNTMPSAPYVLEKEQILKSFKWIEELELPDGGFQRLVDKEHPDFNDAKKEEFQKIYFIDWFRRRVEGDQELKAKFKDLIRGPMYDVESFKGCKCNGYKFGCAKEKELTSSNSGVVVIGSSYQGSFDNYYGRLQEVLKLYYHNGNQVVLFKCHWFDHTTHVKVDRNRMITVDVKSKLRAEDVFVLASHAHQVYYAPSITNPKSSCMFENDFSYHEYNEDKNKEKDDDEERSIHEESDSDHDDLA